MASVGRQLTRSVVCHLRQPRWNQLLLKSNMNLHLLSIYHQRRFSMNSEDDGSEAKAQKKKKDCNDYKKKPWIEGDQPKEMPCLEPACPKIRITKRRKFLEDKKCKELKAEEKCDDNPCATCSISTFLRGRRKFRISVSWDKVKGCLLCLSQLRFPHPDPVNLNQERTFCKNVQRESCSVTEPSPKPPVPPKSNRITRKRKHLLAMKQKEAEAKASPESQEPRTPNLDQAFDELKQVSMQNSTINECENQQKEAEAKASPESQELCTPNLDEAVDKLKQASMQNSKINECEKEQFKSLCEDLKISKGNDEAMPTDNILKCMLAGVQKVCAFHAEKKLCAKENAAEEVAKLQSNDETNPMSFADKKISQETAELKRLLEEIKKKCKKHREELEAECKQKAEAVALKKESQLAKIKKLCEEAKLRKQCEQARVKKEFEEADSTKKCNEFVGQTRGTAPVSMNDCTNDD